MIERNEEIKQEPTGNGMMFPMNMKEATVSAVLKRADGTIVDLGVVSSTNKWKNFKAKVKLFVYKYVLKKF